MHRPTASLGFIALSATALAGVLLLADRLGVPARELTPDPNSVAGQSAYVGVLSTLGVMLWGAIAAACLFGGAVLRGLSRDPSGAGLLLGIGALCLILGVDDAALVHENVAPDSLGVPQEAVLAVYLALGLSWAVAFRDELRNSNFVLLLCAAACFAASLAIDLAEASRVAEDYFKFVGMFALGGWAFGEAGGRLRAALL